MTDGTSARFALPLLAAGQAQKEILHNEALTILDVALHAAVETVGATSPPATPEIGQTWALAALPDGAWTGQGGTLASWTQGGWRFVALPPGAAVWDKADARTTWRTASGWTATASVGAVAIGGAQVVGPRMGAIAAPSGGATQDAEARATLASLLVMLRSHGLIAT